MKESEAMTTQGVKENQKQVLKLNFVLGDVSSLNPHDLATGARGLALGKWLFEGLTRLNLHGEYELAGAQEVNISPCQTRYVFTLRSNHYSNGTPVVAQDYERSWKAAITSGTCAKAHLFYCIKNAEKAKKGQISMDSIGVKALDSKTLIVDLEHPTSYFLSLVSNPLFAPFDVKDNLIAFSGPYQLAEWKKNDTLTLEVNPFFWDQRQIHIKKIKIFTVKDSTTAFSLYQKGTIDWIGDPFSWLPPEILSSEISEGRLFKSSNIIYPFWVHLNTEYFPLSSALIRRALSCVIDRNQVAKHISIGDDPLFNPLPTGEPVADLTNEGSEIAKGKILFEKGLKELHLTKEKFPTLRISSCSLSGHKKIAEYLQQRWASIFDIQVELDIQEWGTFLGNLKNGDYQIGGYFVSADYDDLLACFELLSSGTNLSMWKDAQYRATINQIRKESTPSLRAALFKKAEEILRKEMPIIWITNRSHYHSYPSNLKGLCFDQRGTPDLRWAYFE